VSETRQVIFHKAEPPRNANAPYRLTDTSNTEYAVWDMAMWDLIRLNHMNQTLTIEAETKPSKDGRFQNHNLLAFASNGSEAPPLASMAAPAAAAWPTAPPSQVPGVGSIPPEAYSQDPKAHAIAKAVALKAAIDLYPHLDPKPPSPSDLLIVADMFLPWLES
jgi:hypothetical protein